MTDMMVYLTKLLTPWRLLSPVDGNNKVASLKAIMAAPDERLGFRIDRGDQRLQSEPSFAAKRQVFLPQQGSNHLVVSAILARLAKKSRYDSLIRLSNQYTYVKRTMQHVRHIF